MNCHFYRILRSQARSLCFGFMLGASLLVGCGGPEASELSVEEQVQAGVKALQIFDFEQSREILLQAQPKVDVSDETLWTLATYSYALSAWHDSPPVEENVLVAKAALQELIERYPQSLYASCALIDLGRMAEIKDFPHDEPDVETARGYYRQVIQEFPDSDMAVRATLNLAQTYAQELEESSVRQAIQLLEERLPNLDSGWVGLYAQYIAQLYAFYLKDHDAAIQPYLKAVDAGLPRASDGDVSLWQLGLLAEDVGQAMTAARSYAKLIDAYPRSVYTTVARQRLLAIAEQNPAAEITIPELPETTFGR
ncbi:tetratricopeptide repeat protein [Coraliomargarita sp. SDUM461003]|uniref:Tetratricopeptide repeat protein n=2 Tax=Thalassobacterium maritimum TaxID=3041265 RepID=A0ABU1AT58_9BACT|nr:tetratricopeptide repeat protein [Coraliomargarita sp. SDUM461003]